MNKIVFASFALILLAVSVFSVYADEQVAESRGSFDVDTGKGVVSVNDDASESFCGNGVVDSSKGEQCDGSNLNGKSCTSLGNFQGELACQPNCIFDTGKCSAIQQNNGGNNGGGVNRGGGSNIGSFSASNVGQSCIENWECSDWSNCSEGEQSRVCNDKNNCNTILVKPEVLRRCESRQVFNDEANSLGGKFSKLLGAVIGTSGKRNLTVIFIFLFLLLAIFVIVNAARRTSRLNTEKDKEDIKVEEENSNEEK